MSTNEKPNNRRKFLDAAVRWPLLGAVGLVAGRLVAQNVSGPLHPDETCSNAGLCRGCRALAGCRSLQADLFRRGAPPDGQTPGGMVTLLRDHVVLTSRAPFEAHGHAKA